MAASFASGHRLERYRRQALEENVNRIGRYLTEQLHLPDVPFLKVGVRIAIIDNVQIAVV